MVEPVPPPSVTAHEWGPPPLRVSPEGEGEGFPPIPASPARYARLRVVRSGVCHGGCLRTRRANPYATAVRRRITLSASPTQRSTGGASHVDPLASTLAPLPPSAHRVSSVPSRRRPGALLRRDAPGVAAHHSRHTMRSAPMMRSAAFICAFQVGAPTSRRPGPCTSRPLLVMRFAEYAAGRHAGC